MTLRLRVDAPAPGEENMRRDRAALGALERDPTVAPLLRVYAWSPPAVSLGFHQDASVFDRDRLARAGVDLVRRPTGGAAVLHDDEITYCLTAPLGTPGLGRGVERIHGGIAESLCEALRDLGLDARRGGGGRPTGIACFAAAGGHEITVGGRKLVGSALRRGRRAFLQHGSLLRGDGHLRLGEFLVDPARRADGPTEADRLGERTTTLSALGRADLGARLFAQTFARALARRCGLGRIEELDSEA